MMFAGLGYSSQTTAWNRPEFEDGGASADVVDSRSFLVSEHRDSWSPSWNGGSGGYSATSGSYDFFLS